MRMLSGVMERLRNLKKIKAGFFFHGRNLLSFDPSQLISSGSFFCARSFFLLQLCTTVWAAIFVSLHFVCWVIFTLVHVVPSVFPAFITQQTVLLTFYHSLFVFFFNFFSVILMQLPSLKSSVSRFFRLFTRFPIILLQVRVKLLNEQDGRFCSPPC